MGPRDCAGFALLTLMACTAQPVARHQASAASADGAVVSEVQQLLATDREWARIASTSRDADSVAAYWTEDACVVLPSRASSHVSDSPLRCRGARKLRRGFVR